ncbi:MAG: single-stranded-DNA-specific exonuclease RecJ [Solirubrobacteraceae bacterium]
MSEALAHVAPFPPHPPTLRVVEPCPEPVAVQPDRRLELPACDPAAVLALERTLGASHVLAQILVRRGLGDPRRAREFLDAAPIPGTGVLAGIDRAVQAIQGQIAQRGRIVVHGDYDVDGVCATAIMVRALRSLGADVGWFIPGRTEDGYGLSAATVERLAQRGTALILTVDCGITAVEEVAAAAAAGVDVVVSDHHAPRTDGALPACAIVHPAVGGWPCADLCGTGVAFKLAQVLGAATADEDLDLVALATVADLVPLTGENRRLVREGISELASTAKPGLRALMAVARVDPGELDTGAIAFRLAPRINAAGRVRRADAGLELLLCDDPSRARVVAAELDALNGERRAVEQRIAWEAEAEVARMGPRPAYVLAGSDWHPGVIGIVASRIVERHHRPTILIALDGDGPGAEGTGSGRSIPGFDLLGARHACAGHLGRYGGHRAAAGMAIDAAAVDDFRVTFEAHAESMLTEDLLTPVERIDAVASGGELGLALAEELRMLEPCGLGNPSPRLLVPGARFDDVRPMGEGRHARFTVTSGGARARAVAFGCDGRVAGGDGEPLDATFRLERNVWNGAVEPRLVLRHAQPCAPAPIELLNDGAYLDGVLAEFDRQPEPCMEGVVGKQDIYGSYPTRPDGSRPSEKRRMLLDRRGHSPLATLTEAVAAAASVLAVCADARRRLPGLTARVGGFTLASHGELEHQPQRACGFDHVVVIDPPSSAAATELLLAGDGLISLAYGEPELGFAQQMHELEYGLRASLVTLYRALRARERAAGEELERLLRGDGPHGRSAPLAGRLIRVLAELELVSLDRALPGLAIAGTAPTALERSPSYRAYSRRYEDGKRFLSSADHLAGD